MRRGGALTAWRHEPADVSQAQLRIGPHLAGAYRSQLSSLGDSMKITVVKKASSRKPSGYCDMFVDEPPMNKK
jgi:hypothetical protein